MHAAPRNLALWIVAAGLLAGGCGRRPAPSPREMVTLPTERNVVAKPSAFGIPYERFVVMRDRGRLIALRATALSTRGDHIEYHWAVTPAGGSFVDGVGSEGHGATSEEQYTGRIELPGLALEWSRGSSDVGWIYWPSEDRDFAVLSNTFSRLEDVDTRSAGGSWLRPEKRQKPAAPSW